MYENLSLYIDGRFIARDDRHSQDIRDPATEQVIAQLPHATRADLDRALAAAERAFESWKLVSAVERGAILRKVAQLTRERAETIARNITADMGKPFSEALGEVNRSAEHFEWHAEEARRIYGRVVPSRNPSVRQMVLREPVGVCVAFTPWNFPFGQAVRKVAAAIGSGCTLVLKGPEDAPSAVVAMARMFHDAGLPPGVLNCVWGVPADVSSYLLASPIVRKVSFTGSVPVGRHVASLAAAGLKRMTLELGGHSPAIVCEDADVETAATLLSKLKFTNAGQVCVSPNRMYIHEKVYDRFMERFLAQTAAIKVGSGCEPETTMGPLAHARRVPVIASMVEDAVAQGARVELGGQPIDGPGYFFSPTVLTDVPQTATLMKDEPFGPVVPCLRFSDLDDALRQANASPYGLSAYAFTRSTRHALQLQNGLQAGNVNINHFGQAAPEIPFGGIKDSGMGSEGGLESFDGYLQTKLVTQLD